MLHLLYSQPRGTDAADPVKTAAIAEEEERPPAFTGGCWELRVAGTAPQRNARTGKA